MFDVCSLFSCLNYDRWGNTVRFFFTIFIVVSSATTAFLPPSLLRGHLIFCEARTDTTELTLGLCLVASRFGSVRFRSVRFVFSVCFLLFSVLRGSRRLLVSCWLENTPRIARSLLSYIGLVLPACPRVSSLVSTTATCTFLNLQPSPPPAGLILTSSRLQVQPRSEPWHQHPIRGKRFLSRSDEPVLGGVVQPSQLAGVAWDGRRVQSGLQPDLAAVQPRQPELQPEQPRVSGV